jgi:hypothetical protein
MSTRKGNVRLALALTAILVLAAVGTTAAIEMALLSQSAVQNADARGCNNSVAFNASKGRCFGH